MKKCSYCGRDNPDEATKCVECGTDFAAPGGPPPRERQGPEYDFPPLSEADKQMDLVTVVTCRTLVAADMVVGRLAAAGITAFLPDESLMQTAAMFNTYGFVRVQISPNDYDAAKDLLSDSPPEPAA